MAMLRVLPRAAWRLAPQFALARTRKSFPVPIEAESPELELDRDLFAAVAELTGANRFDEVLDRLGDELADRDSTPMGIRHSELTFSALYAGLYARPNDPAAAAIAVQPFRVWYDRRGENPEVASLVARALHILTEIELDAEPAGKSRRARRTQVAENLTEARDVLDYAAPHGEHLEIWHRSRFRGALLDCDDPEERRERFERFVIFDPGNAVSYFERAGQLLPRWHGSYEEIDAFARESALRTHHRWGSALYTLIYISLAGRLRLDRMDADWAEILDGFEHALSFLPAVPFLNDFLRLAAHFGRDELARDLFSELPELRLDRWDDADEPIEVFAWAHGRARWPYAQGSERAPIE